MLVSRFPFPLEKGDKLRAYYHLKELSITYSINLIALTNQTISPIQLEQIKPFCNQINVIKRSRISIFIKTEYSNQCFFNFFLQQTISNWLFLFF
jgi:hypothetical protein